MRKILFVVGMVLLSLLGSVPAFAQNTTLPPEVLNLDWRLTTIQRGPQASEDTSSVGITIRFGVDGRVSGSGGCNNYSGTYTAGTFGQLVFSPLIATKKACEAPLNRLEADFFAALATVDSYGFDAAERLQLNFNNRQSTLLFVNAPTPPPTATGVPAGQQCFTQTGKCVSGRFLQYWQQNGGLPVFGYPLSDLLTENGRSVQYFERQRFELHPENKAPYDVLIGRLGDELLRRQGIDWFTLPKAAGASTGCQYFGETGHSACNTASGVSFLRYWSSNGLEFDGRAGKSYAESLALFGLPLSEPFETVIEGRTILVQWFERARFEWHPTNPANARVLLGRLGAELSSVNQGGDTPGNEVLLTSADNNTSISLAVRQPLVVMLPSNRSTGYVWQVTRVDSKVLAQQGEPLYTPGGTMPGSGGSETFRFLALRAGQTRLVLEYRQPFDPNSAPAETFSLLVTVK